MLSPPPYSHAHWGRMWALLGWVSLATMTAVRVVTAEDIPSPPVVPTGAAGRRAHLLGISCMVGRLNPCPCLPRTKLHGRSVTSGLGWGRSLPVGPAAALAWGGWGAGSPGLSGRASPLQQVVRLSPPGSRPLPLAAQPPAPFLSLARRQPALSRCPPGLGRLCPSRGAPLRRRRGHPRCRFPQEGPARAQGRSRRRSSLPPPGAAAAPWDARGRSPRPVGGEPGLAGLPASPPGRLMGRPRFPVTLPQLTPNE